MAGVASCTPNIGAIRFLLCGMHIGRVHLSSSEATTGRRQYPRWWVNEIKEAEWQSIVWR